MIKIFVNVSQSFILFLTLKHILFFAKLDFFAGKLIPSFWTSPKCGSFIIYNHSDSQR
jgi:hypothetical protein